MALIRQRSQEVCRATAVIHVHQICLILLISSLFWARRAVIAIDWEPLVNPTGETPGMTEQGSGGGNGFLQISDGDVRMRRMEAEYNKLKGEKMWCISASGRGWMDGRMDLTLPRLLILKRVFLIDSPDEFTWLSKTESTYLEDHCGPSDFFFC